MMAVERREELRRRIAELREELDTHRLRFKKLVSEAEEARKTRDGLNDEVKGLSQEIRKVFDERAEHIKRIEVLKGEKNRIYDEMSPYSSSVKELKEIRNRFNEAARGREESLLRRLEDIVRTLREKDLSPKQELILFEQAIILGYRIIARRAADAVHRKILEMGEEELLPYIEKLKALDAQMDEEYRAAKVLLERARELIAKRDALREEAQKNHQRFISLDREIKELKVKMNAARLALKKLREEERDLVRKLRGGRRARLMVEKEMKLKEARKKYQKGETLSLDELRLLMEAGDF